MVTRNNQYGFKHTVITLTLFLSAFITHANGQQVTLSPSKDNTLYESPTGSVSNGAGAHIFAGKTSTPSLIRRGLLAFNVSGSIPSGATITSATLTLTMTQTSIANGAQSISLHRVLADWGEGSSIALGNEGQGAPSTTGDATWIHSFFNTILWASPGGDFAPTLSASQVVDSLGSYTWGPTTQMVADVQNWLNNPAVDFGWILIGNESTSQTAKRFASRQNTDPTMRPLLTVTYTPPVGVNDEGESLVKEFVLHQNYPNPFNPSTTIVYQIRSRESVELRMFDVLGRDVATLVNEVKPPGEYSVSLDGSHLASGVYLYRLKAGGGVQTRKLVLLR